MPFAEWRLDIIIECTSHRPENLSVSVLSSLPSVGPARVLAAMVERLTENNFGGIGSFQNIASPCDVFEDSIWT